MDKKYAHNFASSESNYAKSSLSKNLIFKWLISGVFLLLLIWVLSLSISSFNATGQCLSKLESISDIDMKRQVVKSFLAHSIEGENVPEGIQRSRKIMILDRNVTEEELIERNKSGTLLGLINERALLVNDSNQIFQFTKNIDMGEFTILDHHPGTTYELNVFPGKAFRRVDSKKSIELFDNLKAKNPRLFDGSFNNFGNYFYEYKYFILDTTCCNGRPFVELKETLGAKIRNLELIDFVRKNSSPLIVSNCGLVWFPFNGIN